MTLHNLHPRRRDHEASDTWRPNIRRPSLPRPVALPSLNPTQVEDYERACALLSAVIASYSALINEVPDDKQAALLSEKNKLVRARRSLSPLDSEAALTLAGAAVAKLARWNRDSDRG